MSADPRSSPALRGAWLRVAAIFAATQLALLLVTRHSFLPAFTPLVEVPYNVKWWLAVTTMWVHEGPLGMWTPYPPVFPLLHLGLFRLGGFDAEALWRHFFLGDASVAAIAAASVRRVHLLWSAMNAALLAVLAILIARLVTHVRGREWALVAGGAYLLMSQSYPSRVLIGIQMDQFDYLPCAFLLVAVLALIEGRANGAAVATALGAMTKLFPAVLLPVALLSLPDWRKRAVHVGVCAAVGLGVSLPFMVGGEGAFWSFLAFTGSRSGWESVWIYPVRRLPPWPTASEMRGLFDVPYTHATAAEAVVVPQDADLGRVLLLATVMALAGVVVLARKHPRAPMQLVRAALLSVLALLFFAKGFSSYFIQWFLPLLFVVYRVEVAAAWFGAFLVVANLEFVGDPATWPFYWPSLFARHAMLAALAFDLVRRFRSLPVTPLAPEA